MVLLQDLKYALRALWNSPSFTVVATVTIGLTIGANTAMFSFVSGTLLRPLPYPEPDRIVRVFERAPNTIRSNVSTLNYLDWREQSTVFEHTAADAIWITTLTGSDEPVRIVGARVSARYFDIMQTVPTIGRGFRPGEDERGSDDIVLLSHRLWESRFGSDAGIVGRDILLDGKPHTVIGVLPQGSAFDRRVAQIWKPLAFGPAEMARNFHWINVSAKLRPGVTLAQAQAEMDVIGERIATEYPASNQGWGVNIVPLADVVVGAELRTAVVVLFAATVLVLLIGCANLASLALARGIARTREIGVRASLGAGRWRLARQFLTENLLLSLCGGLVGIGVGYATLGWIQTLLPPLSLPAEVDLRMDIGVMLFALVLAMLTGLLFGLAPAVQASRADLAGAMKTGGHGATRGGAGERTRGTLVVSEVALAFVLLVGAGLLMRSFLGLLDTDPGFDASNVLTAGLPIAQNQYPDAESLDAYIESIRSAIVAIPGVTQTAFTSALPLRGWGYGMPYLVADREFIDLANRPFGFFKMVSPSYFQTLGIEFRAGRAFAEGDTASSPKVMVINETLAQREFAGQDPIGQRMLVQQVVPGSPELGPETAWEIVGVIADEKVTGMNDENDRGMYVSNRQSPVYGGSLIVRAGMDPAQLQTAIRAAVDRVNKDQALSDIRTLEQITAQSVVSERAQSTLFGVFAAIALLLAAVGIYGVISYSVAQRAHEMGIRAALGASAGSLYGLVVRGGMRLVLIGLAIGLLGSLAVTRVMNSMLYGVGARDPVTIAGVALVLAVVAAAACFVPARRVTKVDPNVALRYQ